MGASGQYPASTDLIERLMRANGVDPAMRGAIPELQRKLTAKGRHVSEQQLRRWHAGQHRPSLEAALAFLEQAGVLDWGAALATDPEIETVKARLQGAVLDVISVLDAVAQVSPHPEEQPVNQSTQA